MTWGLSFVSTKSRLCIWIITSFITIFSANCSNLPCHFYDSINITNGIRQQNNRIKFDGVEFPSNQYATVDYTEDDGMKNVTEPHLRGCFCNTKKPCHRLCCSNQQIAGNDGARKNLENKCNEELNQLEEEVFEESSRLINLLLGNYTIYFENKTCIPFFTFEYYLNIKRQKFSHENKTLNTRGYCRTRIDKDTKIHFDVAICITADEPIKTSNTNPYAPLDRIEHIAMLISMPFLVITLLVYVYLPALHKNLHGKCFVCYLISQGLCFTAEILNYYDIVDLDLVVVYLFLCSFQWLNVTAFDAWWNLRSFRNVNQSSKSSERKRFIFYMLYALLSPFVLNVFKLGSNILKSANVNPEQAEDLIRAAFIGITFTCNIIFFILTTLKIREVRNEMDHLTAQDDSSRHQKKMNIARGNFQLYLRLFVVMGLTYSISGISFLISGSSTFSEWTEIFLSLQGVWIFSLFILKRRIFHLIEQRCVSTMKATKQSNSTDISLSALRAKSVTSDGRAVRTL